MTETDEHLSKLRAAEKNYDHALVISICRGLVEEGEWRPVLALGKKWLDLSKIAEEHRSSCPIMKAEGSCHCVGCGAASTLGSRAANALRLLAPVAGSWWGGLHGFERWRPRHPLSPVPNPLPLYVEALKIWSPDLWFEWLSDQVAVIPHSLQWQWRTSSHDSLAWGVRGQSTRIRRDGTVEHGSTCPELPEVPED